MTGSFPRIELDLDQLFSLFPPADDKPSCELIPASEVPPPYHALLVHGHHMTVTVEAFHGDLVDVRVLARTRRQSSYARKIVLPLQKTGRIVLFGIVRINLDYCSPAVRAAIEREDTPLGRILIEHKVFRRIELVGLLRIHAGKPQQEWFQTDKLGPYYGRLAIIHCDEQPAIDLLEIVTPE
jgi:chorismate-pyruvate lyase